MNRLLTGAVFTFLLSFHALEDGKPVIMQISGQMLLGDTMREPGE
jgi:hypothetical protein